MIELPESWATAPLSAISTDVSQRVPDAAETFTYIDIGSVDRETKTITAPQLLLGRDAPSRARKHVAAGDTLVSMTRPNLNAVALVPPSLDGQIASTGFDVLRPLDGIDPRWLAYLVRAEQFVSAMSELVQGALYPAVRTKDVRAYVAPIAPSEEQTRIADQLDTLLARIQACQDHLDDIRALLKRFRHAVTEAATSGRLTEEWRLSQTELSNWATTSIRDLISEMRNGIATKPDENPQGRKILRISAVRPGSLDSSDHRYLSIDSAQANNYALLDGDLLYTRYNGTLEFVGVCAQVRKDLEGFVYPDKLIRVRTRRDRVLPGYLELASNGPQARAQVESFVKSSAGQKGISGDDLKSIQVQVPAIAEQAEIIRRVDALFKLADIIEARYTAARVQAQRLAPLVLAKAFRGELTPQDLSDEPASALLARMAAQRDSAVSVPKIRKSRTLRAARDPKESAAMTKSRQDDDVKGKSYLAEHLRRLGEPVSVQVLFKASELPVADFYKQLAWEVAQGHVKDNTTTLEPGHAAG